MTFPARTYQASFRANTQFGATRQTISDGLVMGLVGPGSLVAILDPAKPTLEFRPAS
ncbi:MAG TPA: hypothetical protein VGB18_03605 [Candidatus Thermoplasmatota archaeon]